MTANELKTLIEETLKCRKEYTVCSGEQPFKNEPLCLRVEGDTLIWSLWGLELVFHSLSSFGSGKWYLNDTSGG